MEAEGSPAASLWVPTGVGARPVPEAGPSPSVPDLGAECVFMKNTCAWTPGHAASSLRLSRGPEQLLPLLVPAVVALTVIRH